jgi:ureidoacrylate peracid hydrolase
VNLEELLSPKRAAVLVIDMQNDYCHPDGCEAALGADVSLAAEMAPRLERFLANARASGIRIPFVRTLHSPWTNSATWLERGRGRHAQSDMRLCLPGTWGSEFYAGIQPRQSPDWDPAGHDYVVTKHRYSGFVGTDLDLVLRAQHIRTLIVTGTSSNGCVEATASDGFMRDYAIVYASDCSVASSVEKHQDCLDRVRSWATVASSDAIVQAWRAMGVPVVRSTAGVSA